MSIIKKPCKLKYQWKTKLPVKSRLGSQVKIAWSFKLHFCPIFMLSKQMLIDYFAIKSKTVVRYL